MTASTAQHRLRSSWGNYRTNSSRLVVHAVLIGLSALYVIPFVWIVVSSLRSSSTVFADTNPFRLEALIPYEASLDAYAELFARDFGRAILNTLLVAGVVIVGGILVGSLAGFAFAKLRFPGRNILFVAVVASFMVPFEAIVIPLFSVMSDLGLRSTYFALILPALANGLVIFLFRQFFVAIPHEMYEAAVIDGARPLSILFRIYLPMTKPVVITAGLLLFLGQWHSYFWPLVAISDPDLLVVQSALSGLQSRYGTVWNLLMAGSVVAVVIPLLLLFPLQRYFTYSQVEGSLKG